MVDGTGIATPLPCGKCEPDREWRVFLKMVRYRHGMTTEGQAVICPGWATIDAARQWVTNQGRRAPGRRVALLRRTEAYQWDTWVIYAHKLTEQRNGERHQDAMTHVSKEREHCPMAAPTPTEFQALVPRDALPKGRRGVIKRRTSVFTGWPDYEEEEATTYTTMDIRRQGIMQTQPNQHPCPDGHKCGRSSSSRNGPRSMPRIGANGVNPWTTTKALPPWGNRYP